MSDGIVNKDLYYEVAKQPHRGSPVVFGVEIEPKKNLIDHVLDFMEFDMRIQFVIPLSLLILGSGWFIGTKTWESHTSATEIEKSLCSKTFQDGKNCPVIVLDPETNYGFSEIKQLIPAVVDDVVKQKKGEEDTKYQKAYRKYQDEINKGKPATQPQQKTEEDIKKEVIVNLGNTLYPNNTELKYEDLSPGQEPTDLAIQKEWITAIYNYKIEKNVTDQKIAGNGNKSDECNRQIFGICLWPLGQKNNTSSGANDVKNSNLYKQLGKDISKTTRKPGN